MVGLKCFSYDLLSLSTTRVPHKKLLAWHLNWKLESPEDYGCPELGEEQKSMLKETNEGLEIYLNSSLWLARVSPSLHSLVQKKKTHNGSR